MTRAWKRDRVSRVKNPATEMYRELRELGWERLWGEEVERFDAGGAEYRARRVALVRAVGVVFLESGCASQRQAVVDWLQGLLEDPNERIRRYAMAALPKVGEREVVERALARMARGVSGERERRHASKALAKVAGGGALELADAMPVGVAQKIKAGAAREAGGRVLMDVEMPAGVRIHLRGRRGLEGFVRSEVEESRRLRGRMRVVGGGSGVVALEAAGGFTLGDVFSLRCFGTLNLVLGEAERDWEAVAAVIASRRVWRMVRALTEETPRYRLEFVGEGHRRGAVAAIAERVHAFCPELLNDARSAMWAVDLHPAGGRLSVELRPRLVPDPRFSYRLVDVPAASHPPLAAAMALLAGRGESVWDPFCGSGVELVERARLGGVRRVYGSDLSREALHAAESNLEAAGVGGVLRCCDFRGFPRIAGIRDGGLDQIITNPPLGRRVPISDFNEMIGDLFALAAEVLRPGGVLVLANPVGSAWREDPRLRRDVSQRVDFGGFDCRIERYRKSVKPARCG